MVSQSQTVFASFNCMGEILSGSGVWADTNSISMPFRLHSATTSTAIFLSMADGINVDYFEEVRLHVCLLDDPLVAVSHMYNCRSFDGLWSTHGEYPLVRFTVSNFNNYRMHVVIDVVLMYAL